MAETNFQLYQLILALRIVAAGIWTTSGIGLAMGTGMYVLGFITTVIVVVAQIVFHRNFHRLNALLDKEE